MFAMASNASFSSEMVGGHYLSEWEKQRTSAVSFPLYCVDYEVAESCGKSGALIVSEQVQAEPKHKRAASSFPVKEDESASSNSDGTDDAENSVPDLVDSMATEWTDEKHSSYLDSMEASFVKKMYDREYCALDLCGQAPKEMDSHDPDSAESRLNFPSPFNEFKVWQKGCWQTSPDFKKSQCFTFPRVVGSPWVQHFRASVCSKKEVMPLNIANEPLQNGAENGAIMLENPGHISTLMEKAPNEGQGIHENPGHISTLMEKAPYEGQGIHAWHHRLHNNLSHCTSVCGKRKLSTAYDKKIVSPGITDLNSKDEAQPGTTQQNTSLEADKNIEDHAKRERSPKKGKLNVYGDCSSHEDQVVPFSGNATAKEADDCNYPSKAQGFSVHNNRQSTDAIKSLSRQNISRTFFLKHKQSSGDAGHFRKDNCSKDPWLDKGQGCDK